MTVALQPAIALRGITAGYSRTTVLRDVEVEVPAGSVVALLGPNGAGKTTLLRLASGLLRPSAGTVALDGLDVTARGSHHRARQGLCLIPEGRGIFPNLTVRENLLLQRPAWEREDRTAAALEAFPVLETRLAQRAGTLSGGEQQMLAVARCFLARPRAVLLDEVSMGLAPQIVAQIYAALRVLVRGGVSLLIVEQYVARALELADRIYLLDRGRVGFCGGPDELNDNQLMRRYLGLDAPGQEGRA